MIWIFSGVSKVLKIFFVMYKVKFEICISYLCKKYINKINSMFKTDVQ